MTLQLRRRLYERFVVRLHILYDPLAFHMALQEDDFFIQCHVGELRFCTMVADADVVAERGMGLAWRGRPDEVELIIVLAKILMRISKDHYVVRKQVSVNRSELRVILNSRYFMLITPELPITSYSCV